MQLFLYAPHILVVVQQDQKDGDLFQDDYGDVLGVAWTDGQESQIFREIEAQEVKTGIFFHYYLLSECYTKERGKEQTQESQDRIENPKPTVQDDSVTGNLLRSNLCLVERDGDQPRERKMESYL